MSEIYVKTGLETKRPDIFASGVLTLFQGFNLITLLYFLFSIKMTTYSWIYVAAPLMILNWLFLFNRRNLKKHQQRWDGEEKRNRQIKGLLIIVYMLTSLYFFGLALSKMY
jgi:polyferredoxin